MRIFFRFVFKQENEASSWQMPLHYRKMVLSLIKEAFKRADKRLFEFYFSKDKVQQKPYTFAVYLPGAEVNGDYITINQNRIDITFSSPDYKDVITLYNGMIKDRKFQYKGEDLELKNIFIRREKSITSSQIKCKTLSPFLIRVHNRDTNKDEYKLLSEDNIEECNRHLNTIMSKVFRKVLDKDYEIKIVPEKIKKLLVKVQEGENMGIIVANQGIFYLEGEVKALQMLYQTGVGSRRSYGFGLFEVVG